MKAKTLIAMLFVSFFVLISEFANADEVSKIKIQRTMLPFILCWAVTAHKTQGMTLEKAVIDIGKKNFAHGQIYVAISRVKSLDGLAVINLTPGKLSKKSLIDSKCITELERLNESNLLNRTPSQDATNSLQMLAVI